MATIPLVLKFEDWPEADHDLWRRLFTRDQLFSDDGDLASWSEGSVTKVRQGYGQWLSFLKRTEPEALQLPPADRITRDRLRAYIEECRQRLKPVSTAGLVMDLVHLTRHLGHDWDWLRRTASRLQAEADTLSLPPPLPVSAGEVYDWSLAHMTRLRDDADQQEAPRRAAHYRTALMIAFLMARPVRRRALLAMTVSRHLRRTETGYQVSFAAADMKDGKARDLTLPPPLTPFMDTYLETFRPMLLGRRPASASACDALWISERGQALPPDTAYAVIGDMTERHLGVRISPHRFRHVAATTIAEEDPEHANIIRDVLGHATLDMSEKHYNRATGITACNDYQNLVAGICKRARHARP